MKLTELLGNDTLKRTLAGVQRPTHAIIISGAKGSGRHTLARIFTQALVCSGTGELPCGVCPDCRRVLSGFHPDVLTLDYFLFEDERDKELKVSTMRALRSDAQLRPNQARSKVYLIDQPINLAAQNAMLKLVEEGPAYAAFLIITENAAALLPTVRSRCVQYQLTPLSDAELTACLIDRYPERSRDAICCAVKGAEGALGRAMELLDGGTSDTLTEGFLRSWLDALSCGNALALAECAAAVQVQKTSRDDTLTLCRQLQQTFRDALVTAAGLPEGGADAQALAEHFSAAQLLTLCTHAERAYDMTAGNVAPAHVAGWLAVKLAEVCVLDWSPSAPLSEHCEAQTE